jgi:hypothetical protein
MEPIAKALQWLIGITVVIVAGFYLWSSSKNASFQYNNFGVVLEQKGILLDPFQANRAQLTAALGLPYRSQALRANETLMYWNFDPVRVQVHVSEDEVILIGFFTSSSEIRSDIIREIYKVSGGSGKWKEGPEIAGTKKIDSAELRRTIEANASSVLVYGYLKGN